MLEINNLTVGVEDKNIIENLNITFKKGKTYFLLGKNGSGKSSLAFAIAGHPKYKVGTGKINLEGEDISNSRPDIRSKKGIFLSFQNIPEIKGIKLGEYLRTIYNSAKRGETPDPNFRDLSPFIFKRFIVQFLKELQINDNFLDRDLNVGFSGGEKRKIELLQIKLLNPQYIILDEIDSGLDIDAFRVVSENLVKMKSSDNTIIIITHNFTLLDYFDVDEVFVLDKGKLIDSGDKALVEDIKKHGYCNYCLKNEENCDYIAKCT